MGHGLKVVLVRVVVLFRGLHLYSSASRFTAHRVGDDPKDGTEQHDVVCAQTSRVNHIMNLAQSRVRNWSVSALTLTSFSDSNDLGIAICSP